MMATKRIRQFSLLLAALLLAVAAGPAPAVAAVAPVDRVVVFKSRRLMQLLRGNEVIRSYRIALGRHPVGPKDRSGDCRTPEGCYLLDRRNSASAYHRSIHISYPNALDRAAARSKGVSPGGDVMIHGLPKGFEDLADRHFVRNWTKGCIAVSNAEIDEIWRLVPDGTPIDIHP